MASLPISLKSLLSLTADTHMNMKEGTSRVPWTYTWKKRLRSSYSKNLSCLLTANVSLSYSTVSFHLKEALECADMYENEIGLAMNTPNSTTLSCMSWRGDTRSSFWNARWDVCERVSTRPCWTNGSVVAAACWGLVWEHSMHLLHTRLLWNSLALAAVGRGCQ